MNKYEELIREVDQLAARLTDYYRAHLACRAGCSGCCRHHLTVFEVEAEPMAAAVRGLEPAIRRLLRRQALAAVDAERCGADVPCPLLVNDRCATYDSRPVICRTQGLPLLLEAEDGHLEVDFCPLNFAAPGATNQLDEEYLVPLEDLNGKLAAANADKLHSEGQPLSGVRRLSTAEIILRSTGGAGES